MKKLLILIPLIFFISQNSFAQKQLLQVSGNINFLRVHDVKTGYGPGCDLIDGEVIIKFTNNTSKAYGFKLRTDTNELTHQGMLDILRDAFNYGHRVTVDYYIEQGKRNGEIFRVWLTK